MCECPSLKKKIYIFISFFPVDLHAWDAGAVFAFVFSNLEFSNPSSVASVVKLSN